MFRVRPLMILYSTLMPRHARVGFYFMHYLGVNTPPALRNTSGPSLHKKEDGSTMIASKVVELITSARWSVIPRKSNGMHA